MSKRLLAVRRQVVSRLRSGAQRAIRSSRLEGHARRKRWESRHRSPAYVQLARLSFRGLLGDSELSRLARQDDFKGRAALRERNALALVLEDVTKGQRFDRAVIEYCRGNVTRASRGSRYALALSLSKAPGTESLGETGLGVVALASGEPKLAWTHFTRAKTGLALAAAPVDVCEAAGRSGAADFAQLASELRETADISAPQWRRILGVFYGAEEWSHLRSLAEHARATSEWSEQDERELERLLGWVERAQRPNSSAAGVEGAINFGVIDYLNPNSSEESTNLGDPVQTVASLSHLVRHQSLSFAGAPDLVSAVKELAEHVRPEYAVEREPQKVNLVPIDRDASSLNEVPENTWMVAFGWHMQSQFLGHYDFPYHPNIEPFFISFHCNRRAMLTPEAVEYLQAHGPVGCRDWYTVDLLTNMGVSAFFSGCLTTTLDTYFDPATAKRGDSSVAYVDVKAAEGAVHIQQANPEMRWDSLAVRLRDAFSLVTRYHDDFSKVVTKRLHAYLPARTVGAAVDFKPGRAGDIRFEGLAKATGEDLQRMRDGIRDTLEPVISAILDGQTRENVRQVWTDVTEPLVKESTRLRAVIPAPATTPFDVDDAVQSVRSHMVTTKARDTSRSGTPIDVCFGLDQNFKHPLNVVTGALRHHTDRPLHLWVLCRGLKAEDFADFSAKFPDVDVTWLPCDRVDHGQVLRMIPHISVATMDRLLLPELVTDRDKILYLDLDLLPLDDVAPLFDTDLGEAPLAARSSILEGFVSGYGVMSGVATKLNKTGTRSWELFRSLFREHDGDFPAFNAGVLVLNLSVMRDESFCEKYLPFVERYGMHDQDVLNYYAGERRVPLDPHWNHIPHQEFIDKAKIVHWAGPAKPWGALDVRFKDEWLRAVDRVKVESEGDSA